MGLRGPKPKTKTRTSIAARLRAIVPLALDEIEKKIKAGLPLDEGEQRLLAQGWRVIEQVDGRPSQKVTVAGDKDNPLEINFVVGKGYKR